MRTAIACGAGGFASAFTHGVLEVFEEQGFYAEGYAASSSLVPVVALAAVRSLGVTGGLHLWQGLFHAGGSNEREMEEVARLLNSVMPRLRRTLFRPSSPSFTAVASVAVDDTDLMDPARSESYRRMRPIFFDTKSVNPSVRLTPSNLFDICMLSAIALQRSRAGRFVDGLLCFDSSLSCTTPAVQLARRGFSQVVAISNSIETSEEGREQLPSQFHGVPIFQLRLDSGQLPVGFQLSGAAPHLTAEQIAAIYDAGRMKALAFLQEHDSLHNAIRTRRSDS